MPLSPPAEREAIHHRRYDFEGYRRKDGLWDIEARLRDVKTYEFENDFRGTIEPGDPIHDMIMRVTVDEKLVIHDIEAETLKGPYHVCPAIAPNLKKAIGLRMASGWRRKVRERLGGIEGCTHLVEMLMAMATPAFQTIYPLLARERGKGVERVPGKNPLLLNSCHAYRSDGPIVKALWPDVYDGPDSDGVEDEALASDKAGADPKETTGG